jgi:hypothetical protein
MRREVSAQTKTASISVFLLEELGDARVRCEQLKGYVDEATDLIEKSPGRDHFFEVAGHLIHGIPEVLFKLEKALQAASLAAGRIDYEELKEQLKPEKVEELEKALKDVRIRQLKRRSDGTPEVPPAKNAGERLAMKLKFKIPVGPGHVKEVAKRLQHAGIDAHDGTEHVYGTIEAEGESYGHAQDAAALKINHAAGSKIVKPHELRKESHTIMNAKIAAQQLLKIAEETERTGHVPMPRLIALIAGLERGKREASASGASPAKVVGYFRAMAENLNNTATATERPSRFTLARQLRNVVADQMPMTSAQVAAQIYQQATSREDVIKGFKEANPDMSEADLEKAGDMWERHKDVVKDKNQ